jgi:hypothetical protein
LLHQILRLRRQLIGYRVESVEAAHHGARSVVTDFLKGAAAAALGTRNLAVFGRSMKSTRRMAKTTANLANHPLATAPFRWNHQASVEKMKRNKLRLSCVIFSPGAQDLIM